MTGACLIYAVAGAVSMLVLFAVLTVALVLYDSRQPDPLRKRERVGL